MIDTNLIKDDPQMVAKNLQSRNYDLNIENEPNSYAVDLKIDLD